MSASIAGRLNLAAILDHIGDPITVHDTGGELVYANAAARAFGFTLGEPRTHMDTIPDGLILLDAAGSAIGSDSLPGHRALSGEENPEVVVGVHSSQSGDVRWVRVSSRTVIDDVGTIQYVVSIWRDVTDRRRSEERDRALAAIVMTSDDAIVSKTLDGTITSWNPAAERLFGWTAEEMIGNSIARIVPPDRRDDLAEILRRLNRGERIDHHETKRRTKDGRILDVSVSISPLVDSSGRIVGASKIARDVTARKRDEAGQRLLAEAGAILATTVEVEQTLAAVARLATGTLADSVAVSLVSRDGSLSQVAAAFADSTSAIPLSRAANDPVDKAAAAEIADVVERGRSSLRLASSATAPDGESNGSSAGTKVQISRMIVPMIAGDRSLGAFVFTTADPGRHYDERDLALAEELARRSALAIDNARLYAAARAAEARYRGLFRSGAVGVVVVADARVLDANESALRMLGRTLDDLREGAVDVVSLVGGLDAWTKLQESGSWYGETVLSGGGDAIPVEVYADAIDLSEGRVLLVQWNDVSARKAAERFEDEFLADLAHDLNNPLTAARTQTQLLRRRIKRGRFSPEDADQALAAIEHTTGRMARRIGEMADLARLRLGRPLELRRHETDLVELVRDLANAFQLTTTRHRLQVDAASLEIVGNWDADRLERVFDNLLSNTIKYSPNGGPICVHLSRDGDGRGANGAVVTVGDRGVGIPAGDLPYIFDRFRRGRNVLTRIAGSGIGLAGARYVVDAHGGTIEVASTEGKGTTVTVRLPLQAPADEIDANH